MEVVETKKAISEVVAAGITINGNCIGMCNKCPIQF